MKVSFVIPTHNKAPYLDLTLKAVTSQLTGHPESEVIVVTDRPDAATDAIVAKYQELPHRVISEVSPKPGASAARNRGIEAASGDILAFLDDDCICPPSYIEELKTAYASSESPDTATVAPLKEVFTHLPDPRSLIASAVLAQMRYLDPVLSETAIFAFESANNGTFSLLNSNDVSRDSNLLDRYAVPRQPDHSQHLVNINNRGFAAPWYFFWGGCSSVIRSAIERVGGFDESFRGWGEEDVELGYRLWKSGTELKALTNIHVYHQIHPRDRSSIYTQWPINYLRFAELHPDPIIKVRWQVLWGNYSLDRYSQTCQELLDNPDSIELVQEIERAFDDFRTRVLAHNTERS